MLLSGLDEGHMGGLGGEERLSDCILNLGGLPLSCLQLLSGDRRGSCSGSNDFLGIFDLL